MMMEKSEGSFPMDTLNMESEELNIMMGVNKRLYLLYTTSEVD